jgi:hypothetical protein
VRAFLKVLLVISLYQVSARAETFTEFTDQIKSNSELNQNEGLGYMISGGIALLGGGYGFSHAEKPVEKGFYSIAQSVGLLAIGFGAESFFLKQDDEIFIQVLNSGELSSQQKNRMLESYLREKRKRTEDTIWIRRTTFGIAGALNLIYAGQARDQSLRNLLFVTAGAQLVWAFSF